MKKLDTTEKEKEENYTSHKKGAQDFLKRLRVITEKEEVPEALPLWKRLSKPLIPMWKGKE